MAIAAFVQNAQALPEPTVVLTVQERDYSLIFDYSAATFSIAGGNGRGTLATYSIPPKRVLSAAGLIANDVKTWHDIQQQMSSDRSQREELEP